jgi:hypothetical protein
MNPRLLATLVLGAALVLGAVWFLSAYERVPDKEWVGPSGEARRNPFLAAERLAGRMGLRVKELRSLPELDTLAPSGVLLLPNRRQALEPARIRSLVAWVQGGGHLIVEAELPGVADPLLDLLAVRRSAAERAAKPPPVELPGGRRLAVSLFGNQSLAADKKILLHAGPPDAARLISFEQGEGMVSAASGLHFARNNLIGANDNAEFLWHLVAQTQAGELQVYWAPQRLSLWGFLKEQAAAALTAAAALAALWLWRIAPRFGPVAPDLPPARRRLLDHLRASGRYYWAQGLRAQLVSAARDAALRRVARAQPDFAAAPTAERVRRLASLAAIPHDEAERFLAAGGALRGAAFIQVAQTAQRVHSALERGKR